MLDTLLTTKLYIPQAAPEFVPRPHLAERLNKGLARKLMLVSAPAGFGKSTLVAGWLAETGRPAAWLSLDEGDDDPARFWAYLIAAIQTVHPEVGREAREIVGTPQLRSAGPAVISLLNDISALTHDLVLVLDDYHAIEAQPIHEGLAYLLDHQPLNLHLTLIARSDPPLSLARLRAHGQLLEIRASDLQFSYDEAAALLNGAMALALEPEQIAAVHQRTEGWIVGLRLAALSLRGHSSLDREGFIAQFTGSHQYILDYLTEEVLRGLPDAQRQFLLRTSILDQFCAPLCHAVTGNADCPRMLDEIRIANLFLIPLGRTPSDDTGGRWFRYHHLFAGLLRTLLERDHPGASAALHQRAAVWFDEQGFPAQAVDHALRSGDPGQAKELFFRHWLSVFHSGGVATVLRWLDALPEPAAGVDPSLAVAHCWALFLSGQSTAIGPPLERACEAYDRLVAKGALSGVPQSLIAAHLAMMRSVLARGRADHARSVAYGEEAVRLAPPEMQETTGTGWDMLGLFSTSRHKASMVLDAAGTAWNMLGGARAGAGDYEGAIEAHKRGIELVYGAGNLVGAHMSTYAQAMYLIVQGRLGEAEHACRSMIERGLRDGYGDLPAAGWPHVAMARIELERDRLEEAEAYLDDGLRIARPGGQGELLRAGRYLGAQLAAARGDLGAALAIVEDAERIVSALDDPYQSGELARDWTTISLKAGQWDTARDKLALLEQHYAVTRHANLLLWRNWLIARLLYAEGRLGQALVRLDEAIGHVRATKSIGELIRLLALQAVALEARGRRDSTRSALREALELGAPEGYVRRWIDAGPSIAPLLRELRDQSDTPQVLHTYLDTLLDACRRAFGDLALQPLSKMLDPLTPRELEVTRLICQGYSNAEIARQLVVAVSTVKKHTSHVYDKLGVRSRAQAIARAHDLGLV